MSRMESKSVWSRLGGQHQGKSAFLEPDHLARSPLAQAKASEPGSRLKPGLY